MGASLAADGMLSVGAAEMVNVGALAVGNLVGGCLLYHHVGGVLGMREDGKVVGTSTHQHQQQGQQQAASGSKGTYSAIHQMVANPQASSWAGPRAGHPAARTQCPHL